MAHFKFSDTHCLDKQYPEGAVWSESTLFAIPFSRAGLQFPVRKIKRPLRKGNNAERVGAESPRVPGCNLLKCSCWSAMPQVTTQRQESSRVTCSDEEFYQWRLVKRLEKCHLKTQKVNFRRDNKTFVNKTTSCHQRQSLRRKKWLTFTLSSHQIYTELADLCGSIVPVFHVSLLIYCLSFIFLSGHKSVKLLGRCEALNQCLY